MSLIFGVPLIYLRLNLLVMNPVWNTTQAQYETTDIYHLLIETYTHTLFRLVVWDTKDFLASSSKGFAFESSRISSLCFKMAILLSILSNLHCSYENITKVTKVKIKISIEMIEVKDVTKIPSHWKICDFQYCAEHFCKTTSVNEIYNKSLNTEDLPNKL